MSNARWKHDCDKCEFLGHFEEHDLYWCPGSALGPTVVARWSSAGPDYTSGVSLAICRSLQEMKHTEGVTFTDRALRVAYLIARDLGRVRG